MKGLMVFAAFIDRVNHVVGFLASFLIPILVFITITDVSLRYLFHAGSVAFQELEWQLYAANFILAAAWVMIKDGHVRIDIIYSNISARKQAAINLIGVFLFCIPFCLIVIWSSWPFFMNAWAIREGSPDPGGLPAWYVLKATIPVAFGLVLFQGIAQAVKAFMTLIDRKEMPS
jgi:TRAP-type mannitol/chloroaromatic compound transport system permease small subunit